MNRCHFLGKVTYDPELSMNGNAALVNFELEIEEFRKDGSGEKIRSVTYLSFEAWDSAALAIEKYAKKDTLMAIESVARNSVIDEKSNDDSNYLDTYFRVTNFKILNT
jgi:single-stranded DNA-binding protein